MVGAAPVPCDARVRTLAYSLVAAPLLELPDERFLDEVRSPGFAETLESIEQGCSSETFAEGLELVRSFASRARDVEAAGRAAVDDLIGELVRDRTYLFRALAPDVGAPPPYESYWHEPGATESVMASLAETYRRNGLSVASETHERVDHLGVELMFMVQLIASEVCDPEGERGAARSRQEVFFREHLALWVAAYVQAALPFAQTDFFEGLLRVLGALMDDEAALFAE